MIPGQRRGRWGGKANVRECPVSFRCGSGHENISKQLIVKFVKKSFAAVAKGKFDYFLDHKLVAALQPMIWPSGKRTALVWLNADSSGHEPPPSRCNTVV
jgi:hypothetical protein